MSSVRVGFIGCGKMAQAIAKGLISNSTCTGRNMVVSAPAVDVANLDEMKRLGVQTITHDNRIAVTDADITVLAVKPDIIPRVCRELADTLNEHRPLLASVAMGVPLSSMEAYLPGHTRIVRCMPNTPSLIQQGVTVFAGNSKVNREDIDLMKFLFQAIGDYHEVPEIYIDAVTGLSGAGPAYTYVMIEALADGAVKMGLPRDLAIKLAARTLQGGARMVLESGEHPGKLKDNVCSPGGCTIVGVSQMEATGVRGALISTVEAATLHAAKTSASNIKSAMEECLKSKPVSQEAVEVDYSITSQEDPKSSSENPASSSEDQPKTPQNSDSTEGDDKSDPKH